MKLILTLFQKHTDIPKRAMAFVDYEHWYYSYQNLYGIRPQISARRKNLEASFNLTDILVFGDFSQTLIKQELPKIRESTSAIIETANPGSKKDMTDFIMLDYIYQTAAEDKNTDAYILFTGDGHFRP